MAVLPLKIDDSASADIMGFPIEIDPAVDFLCMAGVDFEALGTHLIDINGGDMRFEDPNAGVRTLTQLALDEKAKVSVNDTTAGFLNGKLVPGAGITFTENNDGGNETLTIATANTFQNRLWSCTFVDNAGALNSWYRVSDDGIESDGSPYVVPFACEIVAWSWANDRNGADVDVEIYVNGTAPGNLVSTLVIRNSRYAWDSTITPVALAAGSRLSVFGVDQGGNSSDVNFNLFFRATTAAGSSGSGNI